VAEQQQLVVDEDRPLCLALQQGDNVSDSRQLLLVGGSCRLCTADEQQQQQQQHLLMGSRES
jgi:hypothetical protein